VTRRGCFALLIALLTAWPVAPASAQSPAQLDVTVTLPDGSPASHATIFLNDQRVEAGPDGHWQGPRPGTGRVYEAAAAPGFASHGVQWTDTDSLPTNLPVSIRMHDQLASLFDPQPMSFAPGSVPPTITSVATDTGLDRQQELPAETSSLTVAGTVGDAGGHPLVRGDAWLALPDDSVAYVPVAIDGDTFSVAFTFDQGPGRYQVELNDTSGSAILNVPLFVGVPYAPDAPIWPAVQPPSSSESAQQAFDALNHLREAHGLPDVDIDPRLQAIAKDHVADLVAHRWYCHCWSDGTTVFDHARSAGIPVALRPARTGSPGTKEYGIGEGFASLQGSQAIAQLWTSPAHRSDEVGQWSHVGIAANASDDLPVVVIEYALEP
jgi:uncharacterized protein YkwD